MIRCIYWLARVISELIIHWMEALKWFIGIMAMAFSVGLSAESQVIFVSVRRSFEIFEQLLRLNHQSYRNHQYLVTLRFEHQVVPVGLVVWSHELFENWWKFTFTPNISFESFFRVHHPLISLIIDDWHDQLFIIDRWSWNIDHQTNIDHKRPLQPSIVTFPHSSLV